MINSGRRRLTVRRKDPAQGDIRGSPCGIGITGCMRTRISRTRMSSYMPRMEGSNRPDARGNTRIHDRTAARCFCRRQVCDGDSSKARNSIECSIRRFFSSISPRINGLSLAWARTSTTIKYIYRLTAGRLQPFELFVPRSSR